MSDNPLIKLYRRSRSARLALLTLAALGIMALFADLLASSAPLYARYENRNFYPAFYLAFHNDFLDSVPNHQDGYSPLQYKTTDWRQLPLEKAIWPLIPYSSNFIDPYNRNFRSPLGKQDFTDIHGNTIPISARFRHWLGTDKIGRDVAAGIIHGARIALAIGILSMALATLIGVTLGAWAGLSGLNARRSTFSDLAATIIGTFFGWFYAFYLRRFTLEGAKTEGLTYFSFQIAISIAIFILIIALFRWITAKATNRFPRRYLRSAPESVFILRLIEITDSIPALLLLIVAGSFFREKSAALIILLIGLTSWTVIARLTRAETLRISALGYIEAARALGYSRTHIVIKHILPNALGPVGVAVAFGIAGAILLEASLSFLGIGLPPDVVSWGGMLGEVRDGLSAWWMTVFPGIAILLTLLSFHAIGEASRKRH